MFVQPVRKSVRSIPAKAIALCLMASAIGFAAHSQTTEQAATTTTGVPMTANQAAPTQPAMPVAAAKAKPGKDVYTGPNTIVILPPTPMLDNEGKQRVDPDGKLMFNLPVQQIRNKKGHPVFDSNGKPVFQTASNPGYDENGKKIALKKEKPPKMTPLSISAGTLTVDGWTGKARLNYDIADLKFLYLYAPGIGTTIVSQNAFPGAKEQLGAFNDKTLNITVEGHPIELSSEKRLMGKKPQSAWVSVDRGFVLPTKFPVFGYGTTLKAPYAWPGSKESIASKGPIQAPPLPADVTPTLLLKPCPAGMMRPAGPPVLPGQKAVAQACVAIQPAGGAPATAPAGTAQVHPAQTQ
jgi:hypothetical protein